VWFEIEILEHQVQLCMVTICGLLWSALLERWCFVIAPRSLLKKLVTWVVFFGAKYSQPPITPRHYMRLLKRREWLERGAVCERRNGSKEREREMEGNATIWASFDEHIAQISFSHAT
jgi:hypothetical protein